MVHIYAVLDTFSVLKFLKIRQVILSYLLCECASMCKLILEY